MMFGIAMFTIVRSSNVIKNPSDTTTSTAHGFPRSLLMPATLAKTHQNLKIYLDGTDGGTSPRNPPSARWRPARSGAPPGGRPDLSRYAPDHGAERYWGSCFWWCERTRRS